MNLERCACCFRYFEGEDLNVKKILNEQFCVCPTCEAANAIPAKICYKLKEYINCQSMQTYTVYHNNTYILVHTFFNLK